MNKILFIDNNRILSDKLSPYLSADNIIIEQSDSITDSMSRVLSGSYYLIIVHISACQEWISAVVNIRDNSNIPILILADVLNTVDAITAFRIGVDDFIVRPYDVLIFSLRIQAIMRRYVIYSEPQKPKSDILNFKGLTIDAIQRIVYKKDVLLQLTKTEFDLLYLLASHRGQTFTRDMIYNHLWNGEYMQDDRTITSHIQRLRKKIEDTPERPYYIQTVWNVGYRFIREIQNSDSL
ncbi:MAG: response regulator transcription factor [Oscillospiraceae bacterium]|nr:response regulator transcription factor [Oscillospiraceae bacterium]